MSASPAEELERDGYVLLPELLDAATVAALRAELPPSIECLQFPHLASEAFQRALLRPAALALLRRAIGSELKLAQSIVLTRPGGSPGMAWHQDRHYLEVEGPLCGLWIALDDASVENGCLEVVPGSHRPPRVWPHRDGALPRAGSGPRAEAHPHREDTALALSVPAGAGILYDGYLLHRSLENRRRNGLRRALIGHFTGSAAASRWDGANRRIPAAGGPPVEVVAGATAFAYPETTPRLRLGAWRGDAHAVRPSSRRPCRDSGR